jgi:putative NIF3 family GTP cyclohydrolase 1 type 2
MHLNLDCVKGGIDESLMQGVLCATGSQRGEVEIMHPLSCGGYGRAYGIRETHLNDFAERIKKEFSTNRVNVYANGKTTVKKAASFCGGGAEEQAVEFAVKQGADVIVSSDFKHHVLTLANERNIAVVSLTHYASEHYGFNKFYQKICQGIAIPCEYHTDEEYL